MRAAEVAALHALALGRQAELDRPVCDVQATVLFGHLEAELAARQLARDDDVAARHARAHELLALLRRRPVVVANQHAG